jgi:hypothetical protein
LGVCSSADEQLMESLMTLHGDENSTQGKIKRIEPPASPDAKLAQRTVSRSKTLRRRAAPAK